MYKNPRSITLPHVITKIDQCLPQFCRARVIMCSHYHFQGPFLTSNLAVTIIQLSGRRFPCLFVSFQEMYTNNPLFCDNGYNAWTLHDKELIKTLVSCLKIPWSLCAFPIISRGILSFVILIHSDMLTMPFSQSRIGRDIN